MAQYTHIIYGIIPSILFHHIDDEIAGIFDCPRGDTVFLNCIFAVCGDECIIVLGDLIKGIYIIMICINKIPKYIDPLKEADRKQFAALCADLLEHFKKEKIRVKYWEIYNEVYFKGVKQDRSLWKMYNLTAEKLKKIDPALKIGGYAPCWPTLAGIRDFYLHCHKYVDFVSWHKYPTGSS